MSRTVKACLAAKIATGEVVHLDATLIRANVSWDAIVEAHADAVFTVLDSTSAPSPEVATTSKTKRICRTDPDASLGKGGRLPRVEPAYKQQTAVDAKQGVILDVEVTTGGVHDSNTLSALDEVPRVTGRSITIATLDAGYGVARIFAELEARRIEAIVPTRREPSPKKGVIPARRFKLDARHDRLRCPRGRHPCRTANQMRRASKFIAQAFATAAHVHCERPVSAQTLSAGRSFFIMIIPRYCGLGVGILLGPSVNESSMPRIAHVSRAFTEKRKLGMGWPGRYGAVSAT